MSSVSSIENRLKILENNNQQKELSQFPELRKLIQMAMDEHELMEYYEAHYGKR